MGALSFSFLAVHYVGLSMGQSVWSGCAVLVSFTWGVAAFGDRVTPWLAALGLLLIVGGVVGVACVREITGKIWPLARGSGATGGRGEELGEQEGQGH